MYCASEPHMSYSFSYLLFSTSSPLAPDGRAAAPPPSSSPAPRPARLGRPGCVPPHTIPHHIIACSKPPASAWPGRHPRTWQGPERRGGVLRRPGTMGAALDGGSGRWGRAQRWGDTGHARGSGPRGAQGRAIEDGERDMWSFFAQREGGNRKQDS